MKSTGITRQIDSAGRIVLPKELRATMGLKENEDYLEIFTEGEYIMLRKYAPSCVFCGRMEELVDFHGKRVCRECAHKLFERSNEL
ncbi:MAG TPA: AbrB family transcriptional regulator [Ruminococcaceae bacterium]|nr:AbrB family transcriptional regulator [Oscillospiraceae bacterium]